jgi:signal transduction histidine kinase
MRILLIEDNPGDARLVHEILKEVWGNFAISVAEKLGTGLTFLASQEDIDVVLMDLNLPDSRGLETLTKLQTGFPHLPIVIMTSLDDEELAHQAVRLGAQDYLIKGTVGGELLRRTLIYAIERKQAEEEIIKLNDELKRNVAELQAANAGLRESRRAALNLMEDSLAARQQAEAANAELRRQIAERKKAEADVMQLSEDMVERNVELELANKELESFIYSISHDLRAPIRTMSGFAKIVLEDYAGRLDEQGKDYLVRIHRGSEKATRLIDDLLHLSKISRQEVVRIEADISKIASSIVAELRESDPGRDVEVHIAKGLAAFADPRLIEIVLSNLLGNSWKFTSKKQDARIEFGTVKQDGKAVYYVKDNGAGFDPNYTEKMFLPFHRLHSEQEFEGTGIGLTIVERIIRRHGGNIWAEGEKDKGATIYFTIG